MFKLNSKIAHLTPYTPQTQDYAIRLDANESFCALSDTLKNDILEQISQLSFRRYPDPNANALCKAFAGYYQIDPSLVTAGNGSDELIGVIMNAFLEKDDTVLTFDADFSMYQFYANFTQSKVIVESKESDFHLDIDVAIETIAKNKSRMVIFSNPCNPTSVGEKREDILKLIQNTEALVVLDEAYMDFWQETLLHEVENYDNLIILRTASKALGLAGIRLGFAVTNKKLTNILKAVKSPYNLNVISQTVGTCLYQQKDEINNAIQKIIISRNELYEGLLKLAEKFPKKVEPLASNTNFVYTKFENSTDLFEYLKAQSIIVRCFGTYLRITAGTKAENHTILAAISSFYEKVG